jgi:hypothetical protein
MASCCRLPINRKPPSRAALVARPCSSAHGRMHIFHRTPAIRLAIGWLWQDLEALGFLKDTAPQDI